MWLFDSHTTVTVFVLYTTCFHRQSLTYVTSKSSNQIAQFAYRFIHRYKLYTFIQNISLLQIVKHYKADNGNVHVYIAILFSPLAAILTPLCQPNFSWTLHIHTHTHTHKHTHTHTHTPSPPPNFLDPLQMLIRQHPDGCFILIPYHVILYCIMSHLCSIYSYAQ